MFSKDTKTRSDSRSSDSAPSSRSAAPVAGTPSIISADLRITGNLKSNGDIQIDGKVDGDVESQSVTIGENAEVNGTVMCDRIRVCGKVSGEIKAASVVIARTARVNGDIAHDSLEIEAGASLEGGVRRLEGKSSAGGKDKAEKSGSNVSKITEALPSGGGTASHAANGGAASL